MYDNINTNNKWKRKMFRKPSQAHLLAANVIETGCLNVTLTVTWARCYYFCNDLLNDIQNEIL